ncbi:MAG: copper resistance protein CopC [Caulobacteraceae bacterium]|nr:copper resistance protein CopC [Caulobacteraceae bacterium]
MTMKRTAFALAAGVSALLAGSQVQAHAKLVAATPAANAVLPAPRQIALTFSERLQPKFSGFELSRDGARILVKAAVSKDRRILVGAPAKPLSPGAYRVAWHAVTADTHRMQGAYSFTVR